MNEINIVFTIKNFFNTLEDLIINNIIKNNGKNKKIK